MGRTASEDVGRHRDPYGIGEIRAGFDHYDEVLKRVPREGDFDAAAALPFVGQPFCDEPSRRAFVEFFQDRVRNFLGGPRYYAQVLEGIRLCEAQRAAQSEDVSQFFARQP